MSYLRRMLTQRVAQRQYHVTKGMWTKLVFHRCLTFADIFVPDFGVVADVGGEELDAFLGVEIEDLDAEGAEPIDASLESAGFADDDAREAELTDEAAAIPAGRKRGNHGKRAVAALAAGIAEGVSFAVQGGIAVLNAAIAAGAKQFSLRVENGGADGDAAFGEALAGFGNCDREHGLGIRSGGHNKIIETRERNRTVFHFGFIPTNPETPSVPLGGPGEKCGSMARETKGKHGSKDPRLPSKDPKR